MAAQLILMNGPLARLLFWWMRAGHELLARAVFSEDEHAGVAGRDLAHQREQLLHLVAARDHVVERRVVVQLGSEASVLGGEGQFLGGLVEHRQQQHRVDGFFDEAERAAVHRLDDLGHAAVAGHHDDLRVGGGRAEVAEQIEAVDVGQHQVQQHHDGDARP